MTVETRKQLANDPYNLLAVDGPTNQQKSDGDAATWLPSNKGFRCQYVARQIGVKARYGLWVTQAEHDAMDSVLTSCPTQMIPENDGFIMQDQETAARKTRADADAAEAAKKKAEAEKKAKEEAERKAAEEAARKKAEEEAARKQAEEEARRQAEEAARQAEEGARRQAEEAARAQQQQLQQQQLQQHQLDSGSAYYKNCSAVRAAGKAPLYAGQPGYGRHLDRDGDGIACEWR
ncbi:Excalibur (extracellular calcium-binding region) domain containing protein [Bifidobacterium magnum]|uniref:Excalibur (Extracellular calcium-binding region) domain containing protein n=1 Tax=Bifidobacterium magnum TaxID=1692 RepID=A0A087BB42_9BIFI|nr:Excalibur (extracellular calcium-binding region) domain containing protein [Bifidobacterium magnum]